MKRQGLLAHAIGDERWCKVQAVEDELIGMLELEIECEKSVRGEISQIKSDDCLSARPNGRGDNVAVVRIRQVDRVDERLEANHHGGREGALHQFAGASQAPGIELRTRTRDAFKTLIENRG